ncbi:unnamed protein product, partial [Urochloa humidicola]
GRAPAPRSPRRRPHPRRPRPPLPRAAGRRLELESLHDDLHHGDEAPVRGDDALAGPRGLGGVEQRGRVVLRDAFPSAARVGVGRGGGDLVDGGDVGSSARH